MKRNVYPENEDKYENMLPRILVVHLSWVIFTGWLAKPTDNQIQGWQKSISAWVLGRLDKTTSRNPSCKQLYVVLCIQRKHFTHAGVSIMFRQTFHLIYCRPRPQSWSDTVAQDTHIEQ